MTGGSTIPDLPPTSCEYQVRVAYDVWTCMDASAYAEHLRKATEGSKANAEYGVAASVFLTAFLVAMIVAMLVPMFREK